MNFGMKRMVVMKKQLKNLFGIVQQGLEGRMYAGKHGFVTFEKYKKLKAAGKI